MTCTRCGCAQSVHEHYHRQTYCGSCGRDACPAYQRPRRHRALFRRHFRREWEIKVTTPDGTLVDVDTEQLYFIWKYGGGHTNDGYIDLLDAGLTGRLAGWRLWVKPKSWVEPDRAAALDGTAALPERYQRR